MLPVMLNVAKTPVAVVGNGFAAAQRLGILQTSGAENVTTFATAPEPNVVELAGDGLRRRLPSEIDFQRAKYGVVYVCDIEESATLAIVEWSHAVGAFVNVHDRQDLCDFHMPAILRRGNLQVTVSTDGKVAGLSRILRDFLRDQILGPEWAERVNELGAHRADWVSKGLPFAELRSRVDGYVDRAGWLNVSSKHIDHDHR